MENRIFFPQAGLDEWVLSGAVDLQDGELTIVAEGRKYKLAEALHVLREVSGSGDAHELLGRVKARAYLEQLGAEIVESSMLLGESAYDVEPGWIGLPVGSFSGHLAAARAGERRAAHPEPKTEEELILRSLAPRRGT